MNPNPPPFKQIQPPFSPGVPSLSYKSKSKSTNKNKKFVNKPKKVNQTPKFNFLPKDFFPSSLTSLLVAIPISPLEKNLHHIESVRDGFYFKLPFTLKREKDEFLGAVQKIKKVRSALKKFLHFYRFKKLKQANKEDIVTGEKPKTPIWIVDWKIGKKWIFEAKTLMSDITSRLQHHDGFFEEPLSPRNPYTNLPLTLSQNISIWSQFSFHSSLPPSTVFSAFRSSKWYLPSFKQNHLPFLQRHALKETMNDYTSYDFQDRMIDFIRYVFQNQDHHLLPEQSFLHAIENHMDEPYMISWKKYCTLFWLVPILHRGNSKEIVQQQGGIVDLATAELVSKKYIVIALRNFFLRPTGI